MPERPEHFVQNQKLLSCGHPVCSKCAMNKPAIVCKQCNQLNTSDLSQPSFEHINKISNGYIQAYLMDFSQTVYEKLDQTITGLNGEYYILTHGFRSLKFYKSE
jgi:hypothetical protein